MHWQQGGERKAEKSCIAPLEPVAIIKGELVLKPAWPILGIRSDRW
jgi:hypothetical protein